MKHQAKNYLAKFLEAAGANVKASFFGTWAGMCQQMRSSTVRKAETHHKRVLKRGVFEMLVNSVSTIKVERE